MPGPGPEQGRQRYSQFARGQTEARLTEGQEAEPNLNQSQARQSSTICLLQSETS